MSIKIHAKIKEAFAAKDFYTALHLHHSLCNKQIRQGNTVDAAKDLVAGITAMHTENQPELAMELVDKLLELGCNDYGIWHDVFLLLNEKQELMVKIQSKIKDTEIIRMLGIILFQQGLYYDAEECFLKAGEVDMLALMEFEFSQNGYHKDPGYGILRAVGQLLVLNQMKKAHDCLNEFLRLGAYTFPTSYDLLDFTVVMLQAVESNDSSSFVTLCNEYQQHLGFDSFVDLLIKEVGRMYFKLGIVETANPLSDFLKSMFNQPELTVDEDMEID